MNEFFHKNSSDENYTELQRLLDVLISDIYNKCYHDIKQNILHDHGTLEDVKDNVQSTFEIVVKDRFSFLNRPVESHKAYIMSISRNQWLKEFRKRTKAKLFISEYIERLRTDNGYTSVQLKKTVIFFRCLEKMNGEDKRILLEALKGEKNKDIAEKFGYKKETFKKRKSVCYKTLRKEVKCDSEYYLIEKY
jgi:RNA polymerase sigma factor (sigma-70 family)